MNDLYDLLKLSATAQRLYEDKNEFANATKIAFKRLENIYYLHDDTLEKIRQRAIEEGKEVKDQCFDNRIPSEELIHSLATLVYKHDP